MRENAKINQLVYKESITWELYNKFVDLANNPKSGKSHGNYIPALNLADQILQETDKFKCAKSILFLSDGRPSDFM